MVASSRLAAALVLLIFAVSVRADEDEIPVVGRPVDLPFSEASGWFTVQAHAAPTMVEAETPLTFTVSVRAVRPARRSPQRLDLRQLPDFAEHFYIEDPSEEVNRPDDRTWEFAYRLKPRRGDVREIPSLPFVYFNPYLLTTSKGFQVLYTDPIALRVLPHETVQVPVQAPESAFVLATGSAVVARRTPWTQPSIGVCLVLLLAPPLGCVAWYLCWRRLYPDAARLANQRRSRAARHALQALHAARRLDAEPRAARTATILTDYLHQRLDLSIAEPTPREVAVLFTQHGCSPALTAQAVRFFEACDRRRFMPSAEPASFDLQDAAVQLIFAVEGEPAASAAGWSKPAAHHPAADAAGSPWIACLLVSAIPATMSDREILERAEAEFQEGVHLRQAREQARPHFRNAAGYFDELRQRGVRNALLYRNLGNAYLLADDLPRAILSYHRGLRLSPNDRVLRESLAAGRERVVYPASGDLGRPRNDDRPLWLPHPRSGWLMFTAAACYVLGCLGLTRWRMVRRGRLLVSGSIALLLAGLLSGWLMVRAEERRDGDAHPLVVIARDGMLLRRGNGMVFPPRYDTPINRGVEGRLLFERDGWVQIELSSGEIGWLPRKTVLVDTPCAIPTMTIATRQPTAPARVLSCLAGAAGWRQQVLSARPKAADAVRRPEIRSR